MKEELTLTVELNADTTKLYQSWLNSETHEAMTGGEANCSDTIGSDYSAWGGYITGRTLELVENTKIVQSWRTTEFDSTDEDSIIEVHFERIDNGTRLTLQQSNIPAGQKEKYAKGWQEHYFAPMKEYFGA